MRGRAVIAVVSFALSFSLGAARNEKQVDFRQLEAVVREELKEFKTPGAAVAIVSGDRVVYEKGFGVSNVETAAPVTPDMLFRAGSICKMLTAAVLVGLADEAENRARRSAREICRRAGAAPVAPDCGPITQSHRWLDRSGTHLLRAGRRSAHNGGARLSG